MATNYNPRTVTDGLVLCLDAGNAKSYPGTGTTWTDISRNGNDGSLENGLTYSSLNGGSLNFDGTNQYVDLGSNSTLQNVGSFASIDCWFKSSDVNSERFAILVGWGVGSNGFSNFGIGNWFSAFADESIYTGYNATSAIYSERGGHSKYHDGNWHHAVTTIGPNNHRIYVDGNEVVRVFSAGADTNSVSNVFGLTANPENTEVYIGARPAGGGSGYFAGEIPIVKIYNRVLTAAEVEQNFNALRGRFGI